MAMGAGEALIVPGVVAAAPLALYRRYRPDTFADVIGQDHVTEPLQRALLNNKVNHAYLFSGPRGCGKTTSARILARTLNCERAPIAEPCGECQSCRDLARGGPGSIDVIEIDAASHGGVDDARDLRERAFFAPVNSRYKVYIVDEAHMVTTAGFNALLKLVEEPPPHVKFIFATTEPDKVIGTIRSRTHHYPFRLVPPKVLSGYLAKLCEAEGIDVEPTVLPLVVRAGAGSVRDSLSVLDQLLGGAAETGVSYQQATALLGYTPDSLLDEILDAFAAGDSAGVFSSVDKVIEVGQDPRRFGEDLLRRLRDLVIVSAVPDALTSGLVDVAADQAERLTSQAASLGAGELTRAAEVIAAGLTEMRGTTAPRLHLELMCARILLPGTDLDDRGVHARLDRLERRMGMTGAGGTVDGAGIAQNQSRPEAAPQSGAGSGPTQTSPSYASPAGVPATGTPAYANPTQAASAGRTQAGSADPSSFPEPVEGRPGQASAEPAEPSQGNAGPVDAGPANAGPSGPGQSDYEQSPAGHPDAAPSQAGPGSSSGRDAAAEGQRSTSQADVSPAGSTPPAEQPPAQQPPAQQPPAQQPPAQQAPPQQSTPSGPPQSGALTVTDVRRLWPEILEEVKGRRRFTWMLLSQNAHVTGVHNGVLTLGMANAGARDHFSKGGSEDVLADSLVQVLGVNVRIETIVDPGPGSGGGPAAPPSKPTPPPADPDWPAPASLQGGSSPSAPSQGGPSPSGPSDAGQQFDQGPPPDWAQAAPSPASSEPPPWDPPPAADALRQAQGTESAQETGPTSPSSPDPALAAKIRQGIRPTRTGGRAADADVVDDRDLAADRSDSNVEDSAESHTELLVRHLGAEIIAEEEHGA